ncbi:MAG: hypothetical protein WAX57_01005, partial [Minisyncoccia bacterium]
MWNLMNLKRWDYLFFGVVACSILGFVLWQSSHYVMAFRTVKTAHVFATEVAAVGWQNKTAALGRELDPEAELPGFNEANSAFILIEGLPRPDPVVVPIGTDSETEISPPLPSEPETREVEIPEAPAQESEAPVDTEIPVVESEALPTEESTSTPAEIPEEESATSTPETDVGEVQSSRKNLEAFAAAFLSSFTTQVFAQTTADTDPEDAEMDADEQALCSFSATTCHTIELTGFDVGSDLKEKNFKSATLNFSFASRAPDDEVVDNRLLVRYFHNGAWRSAGEIYFNKELSNAANGGYFTSSLEGVEDWEDLDDIRVVIEYERANEYATTEVYLDSAWVDVDYKERAQDVLQSTDTEPVEVPQNVSFDVPATPRNPSVTLPDGTEATFRYTDSVGGELSIHTDKNSYARAGDAILVSITNSGSTAESLRLLLAFPEGRGEIREASQLLRNVPKPEERPVLEDVTYFCESVWEAINGDSASTTPEGDYRCNLSNEIQTCSWLNEEKTNCLVKEVEVGVETEMQYVSAWVPLEIDAEPEGSVSERAGYTITSAIQEPLEVMPGQTIYLKLMLDSPGEGPVRFALYAEGQSLSAQLISELLQEESAVRDAASLLAERKSARQKGNVPLFSTLEFSGDDIPEFRFTFTSRRGVIARALNSLLGRGNEFSVAQVRITDANGTEEDIPVSITYGENGTWTMQIKSRPRAFRPGKYSAEIIMKEGADTFTEEVEFYWGILALNVDKSVYKPGEPVTLMMAVLDESGNTVCDADLELTVSSPDGTVTELPISTSGNCQMNNVVDAADYTGIYSTSVSGTYHTALTEYGTDGSVLHRVFDSFTVEPVTPFIIMRRGATRIYPVENYSMEISVTAESDFTGEFIEAIPTDFLVLDADGAEVRMYGGAKNLAWPITLTAGETATFTYTYDAPDISPYLYLLGPAEVRASEGAPFSEGRQWKLASDATGNMLLYWDQTYIPTGWTCVSCLPADPFYQRFVMGSSTPGVNGGAATHTHTATGAVTASSGTQGVDTNNQATPVVAHTHTYTPTISSPSSLPPYRQLAVIQYNSTGEPPSIPAGAIAFFDAAVPGGWTTYTAQDGRFIRSESTTTIATTGGSNTHTHTITGNTGAAGTTVNVRNPGTSVTVAAAAHTHAVSSSTESVSNVPPYIEVILGKLTATTTATDAMIAMWSGDPAVGWGTVSSTSEAFANRFVLASTTYGATGGATTHSHTNVTGITSGAPSATVARDSTPVNTNVASQAHTHSVDVTSFSTDSHLPPYRTAVFAKRAGGAFPIAPTIDVLFDNEKTGTSTPEFEFTSNDPDGSDALIYQIQWDDDGDLDSSPLGDRTSDVETGCSPNCFENLITPGDTSPFNEAERIRFSIQTPLVSGTTYYWRVRAQGSGSTWGSWATTTSFTYVANTDPSQWFQTEDAQFDSNTQSGVETFGSHSARLSLAAPTEALVAYGESTVQTPRYRFWDGSAWTAENSAQSVGGTIQWVISKGGTTRNEYVLGTQDASNDVNFQVYDGGAGTWGNLTEVTASVTNAARRGFDIAYETNSGDAIIVYCDGDADPSYRVWNGTILSGPTTVNLASANNCEYVKLASDPISDELILVSRDTGAGYEAQVWDGSAWGNSKTLGSMTDVAHEGIAVEYEESGNQAVLVVSNGNTNGFVWSSWDGTSWGVTATQAIGDDFEWGRLRPDVGSDNLSL